MIGISRLHVREIDLTAMAAGAATVALGVLVRHMLNPDGVAYLDLTAALGRGDFHHFVQGYWSPLYPVLVLAASLGVDSPSGAVAIAHLVNVAFVLATIWIIWRWARQMHAPWFGRGAIAALVVCSAEPPRVEALTPDLILLALMACIAYEMIVRRSERWLWLGLLFGATYLTKTGTWPWILVAMTLRALLADGATGRRLAWKAHAVTAVVMACWMVPLSIRGGYPTLGSTGRLNLRWYLRSSDARSPDTHLGMHANYHDAGVEGALPVRWVAFDSSAAWTYQPWSTPDEWSAGITRERSVTPTPRFLLSYWTEMVRLTASIWLRTLTIFVLLPALWIGRKRLHWRRLVATDRRLLLSMILGVIGIAEYVAVHAEPRLIAPFALLLALERSRCAWATPTILQAM